MTHPYVAKTLPKSEHWQAYEAFKKLTRAGRDAMKRILTRDTYLALVRQERDDHSRDQINLAKKTVVHLQAIRSDPTVHLLAMRPDHRVPPGIELQADGNMMIKPENTDTSAAMHSTAMTVLLLLADPALIDKLSPNLLRTFAKTFYDASMGMGGKFASMATVSAALARARESNAGTWGNATPEVLDRAVERILENYAVLTGQSPAVQASVLRARAGLSFAGPGRWAVIRSAYAASKKSNPTKYRANAAEVESAIIARRGTRALGRERLSPTVAVRRSLGLKTETELSYRPPRPDELKGTGLVIRRQAFAPEGEAHVGISIREIGGVKKFYVDAMPGVAFSSLEGAQAALFQFGLRDLNPPRKIR